jgi:YfiR/HmsC-like
LVLGLAWALWPLTARAQVTGFTEHEIKAVYLYNFANFVTWPATAFEGPRSPIRYCVFGDTPVADSLGDTLKGETINGRPLSMLRPSGPSELKGCHVLFIAGSRRNRLNEALRALEDSPTLSVSDIEGFSHSGGMVTLRVENARIRPVINTSKLERAGLVASSKLLRLVEVITDR